ncbi:unnamed protein product [Sphenostylis stenocarpa]|uniref:Generative cell specific-1/HAP2 domain-containing protein n=1 Tax=Sphenostylis stenocarpa TaxID=92480 RepID=A0AA86RTK4_9FABA|nr:unnamed protein product [Sphenostylis stenocarpa]
MALRSPISITPILFILSCFLALRVSAIQIISKSKLEKCERNSNSDNLNCTTKIVLNMAVPSGSSGGEASIVAELVEVEENSTRKMQTLRIPPVITVNKTSAYALYELTYIRDVPYKPEEYYVKTRKCEPDAGANVVKICERKAILRDEEGHIIENTQPICCPCGPQRRMPSSCGNFFDKLTKGKVNTAHCLRFPGDWFHVFGIGQRTLSFSVRIQVKSGTKISLANRVKQSLAFFRAETHEVVVAPENRTVISDDKFLRVNLIGDFVGYTNIPSFEDFYLVVPRQGSPGQPHDLGRNISMWMLLERADLNRISRNQVPLYGLEGRFERINQHPRAGSYSFSIGITEVLNTNLVIELSANDVEAECQFATTATVLDNGTQKRQKCSGFFDFKCHIQYVCLSWVMLFGLCLTIFPTVLVLLWLLHQKGLFDPLYDWWDDLSAADEQIVMDKRKITSDNGHHRIRDNKHHKQEFRHPNYSAQYRRRTTYEHKNKYSERSSNYFDDLHLVHKEMHKHSGSHSDYFDDLEHVHKEMHKHGHKKKNMDNLQHIADHPAHHIHRKKWDSSKGQLKETKLKHDKVRQENHGKHKQVQLYEPEDE